MELIDALVILNQALNGPGTLAERWWAIPKPVWDKVNSAIQNGEVRLGTDCCGLQVLEDGEPCAAPGCSPNQPFRMIGQVSQVDPVAKVRIEWSVPFSDLPGVAEVTPAVIPNKKLKLMQRVTVLFTKNVDGQWIPEIDVLDE